MKDFRRVLGGPVGQFLFIVLASDALATATVGSALTISFFNTAVVGVGLVFCFYVARAVWQTLLTDKPERAQLWAAGAGFVLISTAIIRVMRIYWTAVEKPWIADHWTFGVVTASQWAGFVLCLAALVAPDNGTIFEGTRRPMLAAALVTALFIVISFSFRFAVAK